METHLQRAKRTKRFYTLLSIGVDPKTIKSNATADGYLTAIQYLAPAYSGGGKTLCPFASPGCVAACLNTAGNPVYLRGKLRARYERAQLYLRDREAYKALLVWEIGRFVRRCEKLGKKPAVRLNGTSDIVWETVFPELFTTFHNVTWYDYTKIPNRKPPWNYDLTFSRSENNAFNAGAMLAKGYRVAIVFHKRLPTEFMGATVVNGDEHDMTFLRPAGVVLGLKAKGKAKYDGSGFVVNYS